MSFRKYEQRMNTKKNVKNSSVVIDPVTSEKITVLVDDSEEVHHGCRAYSMSVKLFAIELHDLLCLNPDCEWDNEELDYYHSPWVFPEHSAYAKTAYWLINHKVSLASVQENIEELHCLMFEYSLIREEFTNVFKITDYWLNK